jgi:hypothetical protein
MKPQHNLFGYFTYLVESYSKCLLPKKEDQNKLQNFSLDKNFILRRATDRYLWEKKSKENQKKKDKVDEIERNQMAQIEWNDFIVVDIIEFTEEELNNTVPINSLNQNVNVNVTSFNKNVDILIKNPQNIITNELYSNNNEVNNYNNFKNNINNNNNNINDIIILEENKIINNSKKLLGLAAFEKDININEKNKNKNNNNDFNIEEIQKENLIEDGNKNINLNLNLNLSLNEIDDNNNYNKEKNLPEPGMKIITNYKRKTDSKNIKKIEYQKCPLCNENIPIDEISQHMRIELLDPKWKEINKEIKERKLEVSVAPTSDFINYLGEFAKDRPDLFGDDVNDIIKVEEWKKVEKKYTNQNIKFDGFAPNMSRTTANIAMMAQQTKKNYEESRKNDIVNSNANANANANVNVNNNNNIIKENFIENNNNNNKINININNFNNNIPSVSVGNPIAISVMQQGAVLNSNSNFTKGVMNNYNNSLNNSNNFENIIFEDINKNNKVNLGIGKKLIENLINEEIWLRKNPVLLNNYFLFFI